MLVRRLLLAGLDANGACMGKSLLHWSASSSDGVTTQTLLRGGADPNVKNEQGETPLHDAIGRRDEAVATALVRAGADIHIKAREGQLAGQTPLDMIRTCSDYGWSSEFLGLLPIPNGVNGGGRDEQSPSPPNVPEQSKPAENAKESSTATLPEGTDTATQNINEKVYIY